MILSGIVASSGGGVVASGGNLTVDLNGYRHHYFTSSGTLTVSNTGPVKIIRQDGGAGGGTSTSSFGRAVGLNGGNSGARYYYDTVANGNLAITVGAGGGSSSVTGTTTGPGSGTIFNGGQGAVAVTSASFQECVSVCFDDWYNYYCCGYATRYNWSQESAATNGASGNFHSAVSGVYNNIGSLGLPDRAGGGGGGGGVRAHVDYSTVSFAAGTGGSIGGGAGAGNGQGANATANSGGGGGGGSSEGYGNGNTFSNNPGSGGSGYVIISYQI